MNTTDSGAFPRVTKHAYKPRQVEQSARLRMFLSLGNSIGKENELD